MSDRGAARPQQPRPGHGPVPAPAHLAGGETSPWPGCRVSPAANAAAAAARAAASRPRRAALLCCATTAAAVAAALLSGGTRIAHAQEPPPAPVPAPGTPAAPAPGTPAGAQEAPAGTPQVEVTPPAERGSPNSLRVVVRDAVTRQPLANATVFLDDPTGAEFRKTGFTQADGSITFPELAAHEWSVTVIRTSTSVAGQVASFRPGRTSATVVEGQPTEVLVLLERRPPERLVILNQRLLIDARDTSNTTRRDLDFFRRFPVTIGNRESVPGALTSVPGVVANSLNQAHVRGEQNGVGTYIDGFHVPPLPQGLLGNFLPLQAIQTTDFVRTPRPLAPFDVKTGAFSPEYGGDTGAVLNLRSRFVNTAGLIEGLIADGGYNSGEAFVNLGQKRLLKGAKPNAAFEVNKAFSYFLHAGVRYTGNSVEAPQPSPQTDNNSGRNEQFFAKVDYGLNDTDTVSGLLNVQGSLTGIANRAGLPSEYNRYDAAGNQVGPGSGFGFAGLQDARNPNGSVLASQAVAGQDTFQKDNNSLAAIQYRTRSTPLFRSGVFAGYRTEGLFQIGNLNSRQRLNDRSPRGDVRNLEGDNSIDYKPEVNQQYDTLSVQGDYTVRAGDHTLKFGGQYDSTESDQRYRFIPGSQAALNNLYDIQQRYGLPRIVPPGTPGGGGYQVTQADNVAATVPTLSVDSSGSYGGLYAQDTWRFNGPLTINYGFRYEFYDQSGSARSNADGQRIELESVSESELCPRLNFAFLLPTRGPLSFLSKTPTVLRASYNRNFTRPGIGQGQFYGELARPQITDQYDLGLERQLDLNQTIKITAFSKDITNYLDQTGSVFGPFFPNGTALQPGFQFSSGANRPFNYPKADAYGFELVYQYTPGERVNPDGTTRVLKNGRADRDPFSAYVAFTNQTVKPRFTQQFESLGRFQPLFIDHDQRNTVSAGVAYTLADGTSAGASLYYGSGLFSSIIPGGGAGDGGRDSVFELNLRASTNDKFIARSFGLEIGVENALNGKGRYNFQSPFEGTRFQQGRRVTIAAFGRF